MKDTMLCVGRISRWAIYYENLDTGVYEYTNAILAISFNELNKGCRFP